MMRKVISAISVMLLGASILTFISALLLPSLRVSGSREYGSKKVSHESSASVEKIVENSAQAETQDLAIFDKSRSSYTQAENRGDQRQVFGSVSPLQVAEVTNLSATPMANQNATNGYGRDSSTIQSLALLPETASPRIDRPSPEPGNLTGTEKRHATPPHSPTKLLVLGEGSFPPGGSRPKANARAAIDRIVPLIRARSQDNIIVEGHADMTIPEGFSPDQGSKWNKIISTLRAKSIAKALMQKGVAGDRISFIGLGDAFPLASNLTLAGRSKNRRVEIKLLPSTQ